jgi:hypothetical protein
MELQDRDGLVENESFGASVTRMIVGVNAMTRNL